MKARHQTLILKKFLLWWLNTQALLSTGVCSICSCRAEKSKSGQTPDIALCSGCTCHHMPHAAATEMLKRWHAMAAMAPRTFEEVVRAHLLRASLRSDCTVASPLPLQQHRSPHIPAISGPYAHTSTCVHLGSESKRKFPQQPRDEGFAFGRAVCGEVETLPRATLCKIRTHYCCHSQRVKELLKGSSHASVPSGSWLRRMASSLSPVSSSSSSSKGLVVSSQTKRPDTEIFGAFSAHFGMTCLMRLPRAAAAGTTSPEVQRGRSWKCVRCVRFLPHHKDRDVDRHRALISRQATYISTPSDHQSAELS